MKRLHFSCALFCFVFVAMTLAVLAFFLLTTATATSAKASSNPNIIFIIADDAGWNDFSFHGSPQIPTPNIDAIGFNGVILNSYYSSPLCTPSRGATLAGKYPINLGLQHYVITGGMRDGLPLDEKILPEYLKDLGYQTHLVGKWHLGHAKKKLTPTMRGFDSHFGYYLGAQDYYSHTETDELGTGYDFRSNLTVARDAFGLYNTDLFTSEAVRLIKNSPREMPMFLMIAHTAPHSSAPAVPQQAPKDNVDKFTDIAFEPRRRFAGVMDKLDESVGKVMEALQAQGMLENSVVVFVSDNGGPPAGYGRNQASNWPLRGMKNTLWEGGTRLAALMWSPELAGPKVQDQMMHSVDWLPTLLDIAGGNVSALDDQLDGVSQWKFLTGRGPPPREAFLYNIDPVVKNAAVRFKHWKLIQGNVEPTDLGPCPENGCGSWYGPSGREDDDALQESAAERQASLVLQSASAAAFANAGFPLDASKLENMRKDAQVLCLDGEGAAAVVVPCDAPDNPCLYDLASDPCERRNVAKEQPELVQFLERMIQEFNATALPPISRNVDLGAAPRNWDYTWTFFEDEEENCINS